MKANLISKEDNKARFTMEFTAEEFEQAQARAYRETRDQFVIDGFRRGKAPRSMIERRYGEGVFFEDAINDMFRDGYPSALNELYLEVIDSPSAEFGEIGRGRPVTITITVPVYPVVEVRDYKGVEVEQQLVEVTEEDVDKEIEKLRRRNARLVSAERPAREGDTVVLDYEGRIGDEQFEGGSARDQTLKLGSGQFIPGFEEQLAGVSAGEEKEVRVTFPEEYQARDLAGREAVFRCTVKEVKEEELPELDDEFAKDVSEFDTLKELRADTEAKLRKNAEQLAENEAKDRVIQAVYEANRTEAPAKMVDDEVENMIREVSQNMMYQGLSMDQYLGFSGKTMEDFRSDVRPQAEQRVATRIVLRSIAEQEKVEATEEDVNEELRKMADAYKSDADSVRKMIGEDNMSYFRRDIQMTKVMDMLYKEAKINKVKPKAGPAAEAAAKEPSAAKGEE